MCTWPLHDILSFIGCCARINYYCIATPICIAHTVAILLHCDCTIVNLLPTPPPVFTPYTIQYCALQYLVKAKCVRMPHDAVCPRCDHHVIDYRYDLTRVGSQRP